MKYFLLGSFSSAFFLLGIAVAYGAVGSTALYGDPTPGGAPGILEFTQTTPAADATLLVIAVGLLFHLLVVPGLLDDLEDGATSP